MRCFENTERHNARHIFTGTPHSAGCRHSGYTAKDHLDPLGTYGGAAGATPDRNCEGVSMAGPKAASAAAAPVANPHVVTGAGHMKMNHKNNWCRGCQMPGKRECAEADSLKNDHGSKSLLLVLINDSLEGRRLPGC